MGSQFGGQGIPGLRVALCQVLHGVVGGLLVGSVWDVVVVSVVLGTRGFVQSI